MADIAALTELLGRVEAARGPDHELDRDIWRACGGQVIPITESGGHTHERWIDNEGVRWQAADTRFSASIDAALALVERLLPGWAWQVSEYNLKRIPRCELAEPVMTKFGPGIGIRAQINGATPPLAIIAALLHAMIDAGRSKLKEDGDG